MKKEIIEGQIIKPREPNEVYLAIYKKEGEWRGGGVLYKSLDEIEPNLQFFYPEKIVIVKIKLPD